MCGLPPKHKGNHKGKVECVVNGITDVREFEWARVVAKRPVIQVTEEELEGRIAKAVEEATRGIKAQILKEPERVVEVPVSEPEESETVFEVPVEENDEFTYSSNLDGDFGAVQRALRGEETDSDE